MLEVSVIFRFERVVLFLLKFFYAVIVRVLRQFTPRGVTVKGSLVAKPWAKISVNIILNKDLECLWLMIFNQFKCLQTLDI